MKSLVHQQLSALHQETEALLRCSDPEINDLEEYGRKRLEIFAHLQSLDSLGREQKEERADLEALLAAVLDSDRRLIFKLHGHMGRCRDELSVLASEKKALKGYAWASRYPSSLSRRCV